MLFYIKFKRQVCVGEKTFVLKSVNRTDAGERRPDACVALG